eukprot:392932-Lingulodinium_polyedra.AAC.1
MSRFGGSSESCFQFGFSVVIGDPGAARPIIRNLGGAPSPPSLFTLYPTDSAGGSSLGSNPSPNEQGVVVG